MSKIVKKATDSLYELIVNSLEKSIENGALPQAEIPQFNIEIPANRDNGDYSSNVAFVCAKAFRQAPRKIADEIAKNISLDGSYFTKCEVAGAGFLNFFLSAEFYADVLIDIYTLGENYGRSDYGKGKKYNVEFVSANPTGPMHMGNARGGALGDCLAAVLDFAGYETQREFYVNDAGNQIEKFALSLDVRYQQLILGEDAVELPEDSYHGADITERAAQFREKFGDEYLNKSTEERRKALVDFALPLNIQKMRENMAKYRINYDTWFMESTLHNSGDVKECIDYLTKKGLTYEKDGALWYKNIQVQTEMLKEQGKTQEDIDKLELKDDVLIRQNGNPTYFAADIAYHRNKLVTRGFDKAIDVWGADHHGHVARMKGVLRALDLDETRLDVILMQLVNLVKDGKPVKMSKRTGKAITLTDLLDEIPVDAVRFLFNMREPGSTMDFDLDLAVEQSSKNPVYYCQYANARIHSIIKKIEADGIKLRECEKAELMKLTASEEIELIKHLAAFTEEIQNAAKNYDPAKITRYCIDLATLFHKFYNACRVAVEDESLMQARLYLCKCVMTTITNVLTMFSISVPESM
ncbi:MAG: arginine--tRNA ligase [Oscillospiraceae bacterium]|nr:arginine--tRNA ligase [Oscillospiraceae bacterium]